MFFLNSFCVQAIACAVQFDDQHCGIYAGDADSYSDFKDVFDPIITEYHGLAANFSHTSDMDVNKDQGKHQREGTGALYQVLLASLPIVTANFDSI